jgi:hypothetical protein
MAAKQRKPVRRSKPWQIDAVNVTISDLAETYNNGVYKTPQIREFIFEHGGERSIVSARKGIGKTLLLKAKRHYMESVARDSGSYHCFPKNALVEKPGAVHPIYTKNQSAFWSDYGFWRDVWVMSIAFGTLNYLRLHNEYEIESAEQIKSPYLRDILSNKLQKFIVDFMAEILGLQVSEFTALRDDYQRIILPQFRSMHHQVALFIDNVDEFLHVLSHEGDDRAVYKQINRDAWYLGQIALARAIHDLSGVNPHVRIYAAIRKEAISPSAMKYYKETIATQVRGRIFEIAYAEEDLKSIFALNVALETDDHNVEPRAADPVQRFLGAANLNIDHAYTGRQEQVFPFLLRHSFRRPRDLMAFGRAISDVPAAARDSRTIKAAVFEEARKLTIEYLSELRPLTDLPDEDDLFRLIPRNVLAVDDLSRIALEYAVAKGLTAEAHPFCALYRIGLLGYVRSDEKGQGRQTFLSLGDADLNKDGILPTASTFLVHPALDDAIAHVAGGDYLQNYHPVNIVGNDLPWTYDVPLSFVARGDIVSFNEVMKDADLRSTYPVWFEKMVQSECRDAGFCKVEHGDSVLIIDQNPKRILSYVRRITRALKDHAFPRTIRFGIASGIIDFYAATGGREPLGLALRLAARIEPRAPDGCILATKDFAEQVNPDREIAAGFALATEKTVPALSYVGTQAVVQKDETGRDPPELHELWVAPCRP